MFRFGNSHPPTVVFAVGVIVLGWLIIWWAFSTAPIKKQHGLRKKLEVLFNDIEGPEQCSRLFFAGIMGVVMGASFLAWAVAAEAEVYVFFAGITIWVTMFLFALHRKYSRNP